ncbi:MAG: hypothetical protein IKB21_00270 [Clostridia bacterium]|nr:hypothetical protein [Clostridia bacterium]
MKKRIFALSFCGILGLSGLCFAGCTPKISSHSILAESSNQFAGTVSGYGIYKTFQTVTLSATPKTEGGFLAWVKGEDIVSYDAVYTFEAGTDTEGTYTALFETEGFEFGRLQSVDYQLNNFIIENTEVVLADWDLKYNTVATLFQDLAHTGTVPFYANDSNILQNIPHEDKVFRSNKTYYFSLTLSFQYTNKTTGVITTEPLTTTFSINFEDIFSGTLDGNITKYQNNKYALELEKTADGFTFSATYTDLKASTLWAGKDNPDNNKQVLNLTFTYANPLQ